MKNQIKADLESKISEWLTEITEEPGSDYYVHPELVEQMADAAAAVYDATFDAQRYFANEEMVSAASKSPEHNE